MREEVYVLNVVVRLVLALRLLLGLAGVDSLRGRAGNSDSGSGIAPSHERTALATHAAASTDQYGRLEQVSLKAAKSFPWSHNVGMRSPEALGARLEDAQATELRQLQLEAREGLWRARRHGKLRSLFAHCAGF